MTQKIVNIASYKFFPLEDPATLRDQIKTLGERLGVMGTIILSHEGWNGAFAGPAETMDEFLDIIRTIEPAMNDVDFKRSYSDEIPFDRLKISIKDQTIDMGSAANEIDPIAQPAPYISAEELKKWYDEGKDFAIIDTRNGFEYQMGSFENAIDINVRHFNEFPDAVEKLDPALKQKPVVTFCTGGIRCEKAAPYLLKKGFKEVYQLDGGVLKYFEKCKNAHWRGECFVFDQRLAVNGDLK